VSAIFFKRRNILREKRCFVSNFDDQFTSASLSSNCSGVGLKQSCAALSDLSFVLIKNGPNKFEFGILAKALQREDAVM